MNNQFDLPQGPYSITSPSGVRREPMDNQFDLPLDRLLKPQEVEAVLGVSRITLSIWRHKGINLPFIKVGGRFVRYRPQDVLAFIEGNLQWNTCTA